MKRILVNMLLITLLFGGAVSAASSVCVIFDNQQGSESVILDNDEAKSDVGDQTDCCDLYCSCVKQLANYTNSPYLNNLKDLLEPEKYDLYLSQLSPPLLRPPIA